MQPSITLYRGESVRFVDIAVPGLAGSVVDIEIRWRRRGGAPHVLALSTANASLHVWEDGLQFMITAEEIEALPDEGATGDIFHHVDGRREKVGAFDIEVLAAGEWRGENVLVIYG